MRVSEKILISEDMVKDFSELSGDAKSTIFGKRVAHGMLLSSFFSRLISEVYPGKGSIYLQQNLIFKNPCFINDEIEVIVELDKKDGNKFFLKTIIFKDDEILIEGNAIILKK
jgi:3-hydroxybutyryl-CoA dehydratase